MEDIERRFVEWRNAGSPPWPNNGYERTFIPENSVTGAVFTAGCSMKLTSHISADLYLRYLHAVEDFDFTLSSFGRVTRSSSEHFPISNYTGGAGLKYVF